MACYTYENIVTSKISPDRLFKAFFMDGMRLMKEVVPDKIKGCQFINGRGEPGSVYLLHLNEGNHSKTLKVRVDSFDKENMIHKATLLGGEGFADLYESMSRETKIEAKPDNEGSVVKIITTCHTKREVTSEEKLKQHEVGMKRAVAMVQAVETYLLPNPDDHTT
ncbi:major allergen Pru ar 1-like [Andrographis paniculata]|uniref:major allergen Pru ar 1-like n=1 Tax=Andrographis paniculata TaxID=175694 RepID=UPI0021E71345|nr:major allergen Pru ar 1-like [Andrographis paniculata]